MVFQSESDHTEPKENRVLHSCSYLSISEVILICTNSCVKLSHIKYCGEIDE